MNKKEFDLNCKKCSRLAEHLKQIRKTHPDYHARPVPPFGATSPGLLVVGLGPGMHGANASGRPFTGDYAGILLYQTLFKYGFSSRPVSKHTSDGLKLKNCRITNAVKCLPPENKPTGAEIRTCNEYLAAELQGLKSKVVIMALGRIAHDATLRALKLKLRDYPFAHGTSHQLINQGWLVDSYHCSRYNTNTGRLTEKMFHEVFDTIQTLMQATN